jgi:hypothetical protein
LISCGGFLLFLWALYAVGEKRFLESARLIAGVSSILVFAVVGSYFTGVLPPLPLTLKEAGIYHSLTHTGGAYTVTTEQKETWYTSILPQTLHIVPGEPLVAYSAVFAPGAFNSDIEHVWERSDDTKKKWVQVSLVAFTLSGGRNGGYRGYSEISSPQEGKWRVFVRTTSDQVIGKVSFTVVHTDSEPALQSIAK